MTDRETVTIEWLESMHRQNAAIDTMLAGVQMIKQGGPEGIVTLANDGNADAILAGFNACALIIDMQRNMINDMVEQRLEIADELTKLEETIAKYIPKNED